MWYGGVTNSTMVTVAYNTRDEKIETETQEYARSWTRMGRFPEHRPGFGYSFFHHFQNQFVQNLFAVVHDSQAIQLNASTRADAPDLSGIYLHPVNKIFLFCFQLSDDNSDTSAPFAICFQIPSSLTRKASSHAKKYPMGYFLSSLVSMSVL